MTTYAFWLHVLCPKRHLRAGGAEDEQSAPRCPTASCSTCSWVTASSRRTPSRPHAGSPLTCGWSASFRMATRLHLLVLPSARDGRHGSRRWAVRVPMRAGGSGQPVGGGPNGDGATSGERRASGSGAPARELSTALRSCVRECTSLSKCQSPEDSAGGGKNAPTSLLHCQCHGLSCLLPGDTESRGSPWLSRLPRSLAPVGGGVAPTPPHRCLEI
jgi:hypothetical protein